jgi:hypothetical protein
MLGTDLVPFIDSGDTIYYHVDHVTGQYFVFRDVTLSEAFQRKGLYRELSFVFVEEIPQGKVAIVNVFR